MRSFAVALPLGRDCRDAMDVAVPLTRLDQAHEDLIVETLLDVKARLAPARGHSAVG